MRPRRVIHRQTKETTVKRSFAFAFIAVLVATSAVVGCGGDGSSTPRTAAADPTVREHGTERERGADQVAIGHVGEVTTGRDVARFRRRRFQQTRQLYVT